MKKILASSLISLVFVQLFYLVFEPGQTVAAAVSDPVVVTLTVDSGITITTPADVTMSPNIGMSANGSIGTAVWNVETNAANGYTLGVKATGPLPALQSGSNSFADYTEATPTGTVGTPKAWSVTGASEFGFSAFGTDTTAITPSFGTGADCGSGGTPTATLKYLGFKTTDITVASKNGVTPTTGIDTTVCFAAAQEGIYAPSGTYTATITATATEK